MCRMFVGIAFLLAAMQAQAVGMVNVFGAMMGRSGTMENESSVDQALSKIAAHASKKTPMAVDDETRLDRVVAEPGQHLTYHYTLTKMPSARITPAAFLQIAEPRLKARLCESIEMRGFLKNGVNISYLYRGNDGGTIGNVNFAPSDCGYKSLLSGQNSPLGMPVGLSNGIRSESLVN